jgi:hypothetical protein
VLPKKINWLSKINNLAAQKNNEVAAQNYEFSCPNLRQPIFFPPNFCSERFFFAKYEKKIWRKKNQLSKKVF